MRAALVQEWPGLSLHFGLFPWHTPLLSPTELNHYRAQAAELNRRR